MSDDESLVAEDGEPGYEVVVPNSNPASLFSHYVLTAYKDDEAGGADVYALHGRYDRAKREFDCEEEIVEYVIAEFDDLDSAIDLLTAINGPVPEDHE